MLIVIIGVIIIFFVIIWNVNANWFHFQKIFKLNNCFFENIRLQFLLHFSLLSVFVFTRQKCNLILT